MSQYKTEEEKFVEWYEDAKQNRGLIDIKFYAGDLTGTNTEDFYREVNHFNEQLDRTDLKPRIEVSC